VMSQMRSGVNVVTSEHKIEPTRREKLALAAPAGTALFASEQ
jgi:hypothetical protein